MLHGIKRDRKVGETMGARGGIERIVIRYTDGRAFTILPDAGREVISEDDAKELYKIFERAAARVEWEEVASRVTM